MVWCIHTCGYFSHRSKKLHFLFSQIPTQMPLTLCVRFLCRKSAALSDLDFHAARKMPTSVNTRWAIENEIHNGGWIRWARTTRQLQLRSWWLVLRLTQKHVSWFHHHNVRCGNHWSRTKDLCPVWCRQCGTGTADARKRDRETQDMVSKSNAPKRFAWPLTFGTE